MAIKPRIIILQTSYSSKVLDYSSKNPSNVLFIQGTKCQIIHPRIKGIQIISISIPSRNFTENFWYKKNPHTHIESMHEEIFSSPGTYVQCDFVTKPLVQKLYKNLIKKNVFTEFSINEKKNIHFTEFSVPRFKALEFC